MQVMQNRFQELLNQARAENDMKIQECEELRLHVSKCVAFACRCNCM